MDMFKEHELSDTAEIEQLTEEEKSELLTKIYHFISVTLENSVDELAKTIEEIKEKVKNFNEKTGE